MTKNTDILAAGNPAESFRGYASLLRNIKQRVQIGQQRAIYAANEEMLHMYWDKLNFYCSAVDDIQKPIGISDYELGQALPKDFRGSLPTIEEIERALEADN